ncbi:hypothetical protein V7157_02950, partial [Neobacillus drentensis]
VTCNPEVNIVSASLHFIEGIKKVIDSALDIDYKITLNRRDNLYYYRIYSINNACKFGEWIYGDGIFCMKRKYEKFRIIGSNI